MKTAHKIKKEGKEKKKDKLKSTHTHIHTNRPIKNKKEINSHKTKTSKGEKVQNKYINKQKSKTLIKRKQKNNNNNSKKKKTHPTLDCGARTCDSGLQPYTCVTGA